MCKTRTFKEMETILIYNGYVKNRVNGSHHIFVKEKHNHISIPIGKHVNKMLARRIIKENNLKFEK